MAFESAMPCHHAPYFGAAASLELERELYCVEINGPRPMWEPPLPGAFSVTGSFRGPNRTGSLTRTVRQTESARVCARVNEKL